MRANVDDDVRMRVEAAVQRLHVLEGRQHTVPIELEKLLCWDLLSRVCDLPRAKRKGSRSARASLKRYIVLAYKLRCHIHSMPLDAFEKIEEDQNDRIKVARTKLTAVPSEVADLSPRLQSIQHPLGLDHELEKVIESAGRALDNMIEMAASGDPQKKMHASEMTKYAAKLYERLTGKRVCRASRLVPINVHQHGTEEYGPFLEFLTELFEALGVNASPAGQLRLYGKASEKKQAQIP